MTNHHEMPNECESCNNPPSRLFTGMWLCETCISKETETLSKIEEIAKEKYNINTTVSVRSDLFNAITESIESIKKQIDSDTSIENKSFALALAIQAKIQQTKRAIFDLNEQVMIENTRQRAQQEYLNTLANTLRKEERDKLHMQDITYKPKPILAPVRSSTIKKARLNMVELKQYADELGINQFTLQAYVVSKGLTLEAAVIELRRNIKEAKSESSSN